LGIEAIQRIKSASTQLIANDALEYFLLINDNTVAVLLKPIGCFHKGDYLLYQNRNVEAIALFQSILQKFKGQEIESVTLLRLGEVYEKLGEYNLALSQYQSIIDHHNDGFIVMKPCFFSRNLQQ
jgi:tetratricopeptide (TPR) repeat protein